MSNVDRADAEVAGGALGSTGETERIPSCAHSSYLELVRVRLGKIPESVAISLALGEYVLGMFLIGLLLWR